MRALLPLTGDPVTFGHLLLVRQAHARFGDVLVAILDNDAKHGKRLFTIGERLAFLQAAVRRLGLPNVRVIAAPGMLLADVFLREGCTHVVRGIRSEEEREREQAQNRLHDLVLPGLAAKFVYEVAPPEWAHVSSSLAKACVSNGLDASKLVPVDVKEAMEQDLLGRSTVAVTGPIASGKSYVSARLAALLPALGVPCAHLSYDALLREAYAEATPGGECLRADVAALLGPDIRDADGSLIKSRMAAKLFHPSCPRETRDALEALTKPHVQRLERERLLNFRGLVLVESATLVELGFLGRVNNRVVVVESPDRASMLAERGISAERAADVAQRQSTADQIVAAVEARIAEDGHGSVMRHVNRRRATADESDRDVQSLARSILDWFPSLTKNSR